MVINNLAVSGGYQKLVLRLGAELRGLGHEVTTYAVAADRAECHPGAWSDMPVETLAEGTEVTAAAMRALAARIPGDLDALVIHDEQSLHTLAAMTHPPRTVWMLNNQLSMPAMPLRQIARDGIEAVATNWRLLPYRMLVAARTLRERRLMRRTARRRVAEFAVYDRFNAQDVQTHLGREAQVVQAGADVGAFAEVGRRREPAPPGRLRILSVGVLFPYRRYDDLIRAVALLDDALGAELTIVGLHRFAPDYAAELRALVEELGLGERVAFREYVDDDELHELYRTADVFAFVNDGHTWGISVFEALAANVPVLITDNIGAADLVVDGRHGRVVPARRPDRIAEALRTITQDLPTGQEAEEARRELLETVSWRAYAERMERLLRP